MSKVDVAVAYLLMDYDQPGQGAFPSIERIARETGWKSRAIQYATRALVAAGYFSCEPGGGRRRSNTYRPIYKTVHGGAPFQPAKGCTAVQGKGTERVHDDNKKGCTAVHQNPLIESKEGKSIDLRGSSEAKARNAAWCVKRNLRTTSVSQIDVRAAVALGLITADEAARW